jgi:alpha-beta hydrolase superfamily lysophospholipase
MGKVMSAYGTSIAYERLGDGPAVVLVGGGLDDGAENAPLATELAPRFTVFNYARRGRGDSGDTPPYAVAREIEDLGALVAEAGGSAHALGVSSGGALVLEAAAAGVAIDRIALYDVPYSVDHEVARRWRAYVERLGAALAADRRGEALELFMLFAGSSEEIVAAARRSPWWPGLEALALTLAYDAACLGDGRPPAARLARVAQPTLVITGGASLDPEGPMAGLPSGFFRAAAAAIAASLPDAEVGTLAGQSHVADPAVLAPVLARFFGG